MRRPSRGPIPRARDARAPPAASIDVHRVAPVSRACARPHGPQRASVAGVVSQQAAAHRRGRWSSALMNSLDSRDDRGAAWSSRPGTRRDANVRDIWADVADAVATDQVTPQARPPTVRR